MVVAPLLVDLGVLLSWAVAFAVCLLAMYFARAFFGTASGAIGWIPWVGRIASTAIEKVAQKVDNIMAGAVAGTDAKMGAALHAMARMVDWIGREIHSHAVLLQTLAGIVAGLTIPGQQWRIVDAVRRMVGAISSDVATLRRRVNHLTEQQARGIGADVLPRVRAGERAIGHVTTRDLPAIAGRVGRIDRDLSRLWKWTHRHQLFAGTAAFAGAVAWALSKLGVGWVRCSNWKRAGKQVCGMDASLLESLLADTLLVVGTLSLVDFAREMQTVTEAVARPIEQFWRAG